MQDVVHVDDSGSFRLSLRFIYGIVVVRLLFEFSICVLMSMMCKMFINNRTS